MGQDPVIGPTKKLFGKAKFSANLVSMAAWRSETGNDWDSSEPCNDVPDDEEWDDDGDYGDDDDFDYESFVEENFGGRLSNTSTKPLWRFVAFVLLVIFVGSLITAVM